MGDELTIYAIRKRTDKKLSLMLSVIALFFCLAVDWIVFHWFHLSNAISCSFVVVVVSLLNAFGGFSVWRKLEGREKGVIGRAIVASIIAMLVVPVRSGPPSMLIVGLSFFGIALGAYFALPVQRLVIAVERREMAKSRPETKESDQT
ncbi:MAG: hypothetical protein WCI55_05510 [Armatimonadota bacterium]